MAALSAIVPSGNVSQMGRVSKLPSLSSKDKILREQSPLAPEKRYFEFFL